ncbi:hypothetical protein CCACVL1_15965 [Corchorus capsularis]|uniref:Uncharacterized protein n=1 Tax=Corchorus capsularis TaxID=210143 RepID=A0A1R3I033_COCAP|nr:hypothetical protein CCACVL1_15965 [Corchorus capsularis]
MEIRKVVVITITLRSLGFTSRRLELERTTHREWRLVSSVE